MPVASIQYPDDIVNRNNNGGWHRNGKRAYRKAVQGILRFLQTAKEPRLYHLCFEPLDDDMGIRTSAEMYRANMAMLHALRQMAERDGIRCEWWAAREVADSTKKDHLHAFMVIDAYGIKVAKLFNQFEDGRVQQHCKAHGVKFAIFSPKDYEGIHGNNTYMALPYQGLGNKETELGRKRLADALVWLSYLGKARSKPEDDKSGQVFPASRPARRAATQTIPSPPVDCSTGKGDNNSLTEKEHDARNATTPNETRRPGKDDSTSPGSTNTESLASGPGSSPSPTLERSRPEHSQDLRPGSSGSEGQAIPPRFQNGGAAGPADQTHQPIVRSPGDAMTAADRYIASLYESAIGLRLDLDAMRRYLLAHGVRRTPAQLVFDLDERFCFYGYAASHPAPAQRTYAEIDKELGREDRKPSRTTRLTRVCPIDPTKLNHKLGSIGLTGNEPAAIIDPHTLLSQARSQP